MRLFHPLEFQLAIYDNWNVHCPPAPSLRVPRDCHSCTMCTRHEMVEGYHRAAVLLSELREACHHGRVMKKHVTFQRAPWSLLTCT